MTEDLQQLLTKIQRDGVDKAQTEANSIIEKATKKAAALIDTAKTNADKMKTDAQTEAEAYAQRAEESISQAARDVLLNVEKSVTAMLENLLEQDVKRALDCEAATAALVHEAVKKYMNGESSIEINVAEKMVEALRAKLKSAAQEGVTIVTDKTAGSGFRVKLAKGRIEHDFTGPAITDALAKQLRPELAALLKS